MGRTIPFQNPTGDPNADPPDTPADLTGWNAQVGPVILNWGDSAPEITRHPTNQFVPVGGALTLNVEYQANQYWQTSLQWWNSHGAITGACSSSFVINPVQTNNTDNYWAVLSSHFVNQNSMRTSAVATVTVLVPGSFAMQTSGDSFGVRTNRFGFNITGPTNLNVVVESCTNLANPNWSRVQTNILTGGSSYFSDAQWTNHPARFYRLRWP